MQWFRNLWGVWCKAQRDTHQNCHIKQSTVTVQLNLSNAIWFLVQQNDPMFTISHTTLTNNQVQDIKYKLTAIRELPELMTIIANWWQDIFLSVHQCFDGTLLTNAVLSIQTLRQHGVSGWWHLQHATISKKKKKRIWEMCAFSVLRPTCTCPLRPGNHTTCETQHWGT